MENDRKVKLVQLRRERLHSDLHVLRSHADVGVGPVERKRKEAKGHRGRRGKAASSLLINTHTHTHTHTCVMLSLVYTSEPAVPGVDISFFKK